MKVIGISNNTALEALSHEFHSLATQLEPEELHGAAWDMFQSFLMSKANDVLPENIYAYTVIYEFFRNTCRHLEQIRKDHPNSRFKIIYEPPTESIWS